MSPLEVGSLVFGCIFGSAMLGFFLRTVLPDHHLSDDSMRVVTLSTGLMATLAAVVLGLLISSAKTSFDSISDEVAQTASKVVLLDRSLANYGPETKETRDLLHRVFASAIEMIFDEKGSRLAKLAAPERLAGMEQFQAKLRELAPQNDAQRSLQTRALELSNELVQMRWLVIAHENDAILPPFLVVLVLWLAIIFVGFGLHTANNSIVLTTLFVCALSVSGAIFLIEELDRPLEGLMQVSSAPLRNALTQLGQ
jgi:protein-S-isoprenylcysteine O-methyltransferase Ste14